MPILSARSARGDRRSLSYLGVGAGKGAEARDVDLLRPRRRRDPGGGEQGAGVEVVDLSAALAGTGIVEDGDFAPHGHYSAAGNRRVAAALADLLVDGE